MPCDGRAVMVFGDVAVDPVVVGGLATRRVTQCPAAAFISARVCQVRSTTSPTRPIVNRCQSSPISCNTSSPQWWTVGSAFRKREVLKSGVEVAPSASEMCSSSGRSPCGRVGFGRAGQYTGCAATVMMSRRLAAGALGGRRGIERPAIASSTNCLILRSSAATRTPGHVGDRQVSIRRVDPQSVEAET